MENKAQNILHVLETALLCAGRPLTAADLAQMFNGNNKPTTDEIKKHLSTLQLNRQGRGVELVRVASGWQSQSKAAMQSKIERLNPERRPRYSRPELQTL